MPEKYKKKCQHCLWEFESRSNRNCPVCGSDSWIFIDEFGMQRKPVTEALARKRQARLNMERIDQMSKNEGWMTDERARELIK